MKIEGYFIVRKGDPFYFSATLRSDGGISWSAPRYADQQSARMSLENYDHPEWFKVCRVEIEI